MRTITFLSTSFFSILFIVSLAGCGSGGGSASLAGNPGVSGSGEVTTTTGVATLSWNSPANSDGATFKSFAGFKVYYGTKPGTYSNSLYVGMTTSYSFNGLAPGTYYFAVTTCDSSGNESDFSNEASKTIL